MARRKQMPAGKKRRAAVERAQVTEVRRARALRDQIWRARLFLVVLFVLAAMLRVAGLTSQSLWADEGNSVRLTERPLSLVIDAARADVHPPGYYLVLWCWARLFGQGEAAMRALSVVTGVLLVGLVYLLGRRFAGRRAGWFAAFCAAVSPFQIQYAQEVRMYILVAFLAAAAAYAFIRWLEASESGQHRPWRWTMWYVLSISAGLWTHYSFPVVIIALNVAWWAWWLQRRETEEWGRTAFWWIALHVVAAVLYLPWLPTAWNRILGYGPISEAHSVFFVIGQALKLLSVGETVAGDDLTRWLTLGIVCLAILGGWAGFARSGLAPRKPTRMSLAVAFLSLVVAPMAMMAALMLTGRPAYRPKFFLVASPFYCTLAGTGIALLERPSGSRRGLGSRLWLLLGLGLVSVASARSLHNYFRDPAYARSDYRGLATDVRSVQREGDAILLNAPNQWEVFTYYYRRGAPVYPLCDSRPPVEEEVVAELEEIAADHKRLFVLYWAVDESDPERIVERWLEAHTFKATDMWYGDVRLAVYAVPEALDAIEMREELASVRIGDPIALRGYALAPSDVAAGDVLQVTLFWEALDVPGGRYKVFLHLVDRDGQIVSQHDGEPGDGMNLTSDWRPDRGVFADRYGLVVPASAHGGNYRLLVGMYDVSGAPRLPITVDGRPAGDALMLAAVQIQ
jgi:mannosyltransferase